MEHLIDYSRQADFDETFSDSVSLNDSLHIIIGCGGVGFWLGLILAMQGVTDFCLIEGQTIEPSNLNRLPVPLSWVGINKAVALRKIIRTVRPASKIIVFGKHLSKESLESTTKFWCNTPKLFWDCTDDARIQRVVFDYCKEKNWNYRKIGYEGFNVGTYQDYGVWTAKDYRPGYRTSNACAATSALAAVVGFMATGLDISKDVNINIKDLLKSFQPPEEREDNEDNSGNL